MAISGAWRGGLALGFPGHIPAAFPSKWAPSRHRVPCQSNSLLWNPETKSPPSYFGGVREGVGTPLIQPCSLLTCLSLCPPLLLAPRPPDEQGCSQGTSGQTGAKPKTTRGRAGNLSRFRPIASSPQHPAPGGGVVGSCRFCCRLPFAVPAGVPGSAPYRFPVFLGVFGGYFWGRGWWSIQLPTSGRAGGVGERRRGQAEGEPPPPLPAPHCLTSLSIPTPIKEPCCHSWPLWFCSVVCQLLSSPVPFPSPVFKNKTPDKPPFESPLTSLPAWGPIDGRCRRRRRGDRSPRRLCGPPAAPPAPGLPAP